MAGFTIGDIINQSKKVQPEKDMHPAVTYQEAQEIIFKKLLAASENFISIGYYLKLIRDNRMYTAGGFSDIWEFSKSTYGIGMSTTSRWMKMNDKYSVEGNSPYLQEKYKKFKKSQLQEMLYLTDNQLEQVEDSMTVKQIREIRKIEQKKHVDEGTKQEAALINQKGEYQGEKEAITTDDKNGIFATSQRKVSAEVQYGKSEVQYMLQLEQKEYEDASKNEKNFREYILKQKIYIDALSLLLEFMD